MLTHSLLGGKMVYNRGQNLLHSLIFLPHLVFLLPAQNPPPPPLREGRGEGEVSQRAAEVAEDSASKIEVQIYSIIMARQQAVEHRGVER